MQQLQYFGKRVTSRGIGKYILLVYLSVSFSLSLSLCLSYFLIAKRSFSCMPMSWPGSQRLQQQLSSEIWSPSSCSLFHINYGTAPLLADCVHPAGRIIVIVSSVHWSLVLEIGVTSLASRFSEACLFLFLDCCAHLEVWQKYLPWFITANLAPKHSILATQTFNNSTKHSSPKILML